MIRSSCLRLGRRLAAMLVLASALWTPPSATLNAQDTAVPASAGDDTDWTTQATPVGGDVDVPNVSRDRNLLQVIRDGGPILLPIAACSIVLCIFVLERAISLRSGRVIPRPFVKRFIEQLQTSELQQSEALQLCKDNQHAIAVAFSAAFNKW